MNHHTLLSRLGTVLLLAGVLFILLLLSSTGPKSAGAADPPTASITVAPHDLASGNALDQFTYIVNEDNAHLGNAPNQNDRPFRAPTQSFSPIAAEGDENRATVDLPSDCTGQPNAALDGHGCRYLISVRSQDHKMWGKHITLPNDAGDVRVDLSEDSAAKPLRTAKLRFFVFNDNAWTNAAPDAEEVGTNMRGFHVTLEEQTGSQVSVDYHNRPICSAASGSITGTPGDCTTQADGFMEIDDLSPAMYTVSVTPPDGPCNSNPDSYWVQTTTFDGGFPQNAGLEEGSDGSGAPGELLWEPANRRTGYWAGFVCYPRPFPRPGTGSISGHAVNWQGWPPFDTLIFDQNHPVDQPYVALSDSSTDTTLWVGRGDSDGNFNIPNVPAGTYNMSIWDEQLNYIIRFLPVTVTASGDGHNVDLGDIGVSRWFGWLDGTTYLDRNGNGQYDDGTDTPLPNTDMDQRWPDGSIKESTFTDPSGQYEYPQAEGGQLGKWFVNEQGFARFSADPGPSVHDETSGDVLPSCAVDAPANPCMPTDLGGGLLANQLVSEGHETTVDWGKHTYPAGTPGQIVGITYFATTRNEFDARFAAHEDYEPAIPQVTVRLEDAAELGPDMQAGTSDDPPWSDNYVLNEYVTDKWQKPGIHTDGQNCNPIMGLDSGGNFADLTSQFNSQIGDDCLEVPINGAKTRDGAFDGGYAFADYCPNGFDEAQGDSDTPCWNAGHTDHVAPDNLVSGKYVVRAIMPKDSRDTRPCNPDNVSTIGKQVSDDPMNPDQKGCLYRSEREEDVNVDLGNQFEPAIPPPPCSGDPHKLDQATLNSRSNFYTGDQSSSPSRPLCDMHLIDLQNQQNANADFFLQTNFPGTVQNPDIAPDHPDPVGDVPEPGRLVGGVFDDIYFDRDQDSPWYGEPRPIGNIPIGIYGIDAPGRGVEDWRLITTVHTDNDGAYEALLPSTETFNCPIPQGPCPGMYIVVVNDPGSKAHPNSDYNPNYLTASLAWDVWPGRSNYELDTPLDPISGTGCDLTVNETPGPPELLQVDRPYTPSGASAAQRLITIDGDFFGGSGSPAGSGLPTTPGTVTLTDPRGAGNTVTLSQANGGIVSWTNRRIQIRVPSVAGGFQAGQKQLSIRTAGTAGQSTINGITLHVLGTGYNPTVVPVGASTNPHAIQNAIDAAAAGSLLVLQPGVYKENVLMWKPLKLQGLGPGGIVGASELLQRAPDDPRFNIQGTTIDGKFFRDNAADYDAKIASLLPLAGVDGTHPVLRGADITVLAKTTSSYNLTGTGPAAVFTAARIDGIGITTGQGEGVGGVQLQAHDNNTQISNNFVEGNGGVFGGGIGLGQPYVHGSHNFNVAITRNRVIGSGGLSRSGGLGIFYNSNSYDVGNNMFCSNFGVEYGAGISHWGLSPNGKIHDNTILYNDAVDSGAGIAINEEIPTTGPTGPIGDGSGTVDIDRNLIQSNNSGDDGGGIFIQDALGEVVNVRNNMIVDNNAADIGGAVMLDDSSNVRFINNTVANNNTTGSSENSAIGVPHAAGLASEANDPRWQNAQPASAPKFSNPRALFNNIFWDNTAFTLDQFGPGAGLVNQGTIDFEIHGTCAVNPNCANERFTPRYSLLTDGNILTADGVTRTVPGGQGNTLGVDPGFTNPFVNELTVSGSRLDPQAAAVTITGADPPVGIFGDYHLPITTGGGSQVVDRGVRCSNTPFPIANNNPCTGGGIEAPAGTPSATNTGGGDIDSQFRPQLRTFRLNTRWDRGADELPGVPAPTPGQPLNLAVRNGGTQALSNVVRSAAGKPMVRP
jgi:large repetitive protein